MKNLDTLIVHAPTHGNASSCMDRVRLARWAMEKNGFTPKAKIGTVWLWDEADQKYDTLHDFHCWMWLNSSLYDSFASLKRALMILDQNDMGFKVSKPMDKWKMAEVRHEVFKTAPMEDVSEMLGVLRKQGIDIIYLEDVVALHWRKGLKEMRKELYSEPIFE